MNICSILLKGDEMKFSLVIISLIFTLATLPCKAQAWDLSAGAAGYVENLPYNGVGWKTIPMPMIQFESQYAFFEVQTAGVYLHRTNNSAFMLLGEYEPLAYSAGDSDIATMDDIDKRSSTVLAGLRYSTWGKYGLVRFEYLYDVLNSSNAQRGRLSYMALFTLADMLDVIPELGVYWHNNKYNDYYFGVDGDEAAVSGYMPYEPKDSFTPYATLTLQLRLGEHCKWLTSIAYEYLLSEQTDSPIVETDYSFSVMSGLAWML
jgi:outer membrane protein